MKKPGFPHSRFTDDRQHLSFSASGLLQGTL
jgi:hypothetical protein